MCRFICRIGQRVLLSRTSFILDRFVSCCKFAKFFSHLFYVLHFLTISFVVVGLMQVSMFGRRIGVRLWVRHMNFSAFLGSNSRALGLKNSSNLIKYLFPRLIKPPFWAKFVAKFLREGTKEVFKCHTYARMLPHYPPPLPPSPPA